MIKIKLKSKRVLKRMAIKGVIIHGIPVWGLLRYYPTGMVIVKSHGKCSYPIKYSYLCRAHGWYIPKAYVGKRLVN